MTKAHPRDAGGRFLPFNRPPAGPPVDRDLVGPSPERSVTARPVKPRRKEPPVEQLAAGRPGGPGRPEPPAEHGSRSAASWWRRLMDGDGSDA